MSFSRQNSQLPEPDGTTSTDYGSDLEFSSAGLFALRLCKREGLFEIWMNHDSFLPWDDVVVFVGNECLCVQSKHTTKFDKEVLSGYLKKRHHIFDNNPDLAAKSVVFIFATTSSVPSKALMRTEWNLEQVTPWRLSQTVVDLLLTDKSAIFVEISSNTYVAGKQHNVVQLHADVRSALKDLMGSCVTISEDHLNDVQLKFLDYVRERHHRLIGGNSPLTREEIELQVSVAILEKLKLPFDDDDDDEDDLALTYRSREFFDKLSALSASIVVVNHKSDSRLRMYVWNHLKAYCKSIGMAKKKLKWRFFEEMWLKSELYLPLISDDASTDKLIFRALQISHFRLKVLILRRKLFKIKPKYTVITLLQNLPSIEEESVKVSTDRHVENFKVAYVSCDFLLKKKHKKTVLHKELFGKVIRDFLDERREKSLEGLQNLVEVHDECAFVNDFVVQLPDQSSKMPALIAAIKTKDVKLEVIRHILDLGANVNASVDGDLTPIYYAVEERRVDILSLLLEKGADPNMTHKSGSRVLHHAVELENSSEIVEILIKHGADRGACNKFGISPLFLAYRARNYDSMKLLLRNFDRAHEANFSGNHLLHEAAEKGDLDCLECIIEHCVDIRHFMERRNSASKHPLEIASEKNHERFFDVLTKAVKKQNEKDTGEKDTL